jgi:hypothetical protein
LAVSLTYDLSGLIHISAQKEAEWWDVSLEIGLRANVLALEKAELSSGENPKRVFPMPTTPWKSRNNREIPTFPTADVPGCDLLIGKQSLVRR